MCVLARLLPPHSFLYMRLICLISMSLNPLIRLLVSIIDCFDRSFVTMVRVPAFAKAVELRKSNETGIFHLKILKIGYDSKMKYIESF